MVFETKKIRTETLGEYLKAVRTTFNFSLEQVAEMSGINLKLLKALEQNNVKQLPADIYVKGALKQIAQFYRLEETSLLEQYKKERNIQVQLKGKEKFSVQQITNFWKKIVITPKFLAVTLAVVFTLFTLSYLFWQVISINRAPNLQITSPKNQEIIHSLSVNVLGQTDSGSNISVNDQEIFVDNQGKFLADISLTPGGQEIKVISKNRFGKQTQKSLKVFIESQTEKEQAQNFDLNLHFLEATSLTFRTDSQDFVEKSFSIGDNFQIKANDSIILSSPNGSAISGELNGQNLGILGKKGEPLKNLSFTKESGNMPIAK